MPNDKANRKKIDHLQPTVIDHAPGKLPVIPGEMGKAAGDE